MAQDPDEDRIRRKAHELWEAEGHPHGRDLDHWAQAREIIAIEDSHASALLPRDTGAEEPIEPALAIDSLGDVPNLTDQGKDPLTDTSREHDYARPAEPAPASHDPAPVTAPPKPVTTKAKRAGGTTRKADAVTSTPLHTEHKSVAVTKPARPNRKKKR
jgi:hypothetical protein